jgi:aspartate racemase
MQPEQLSTQSEQNLKMGKEIQCKLIGLLGGMSWPSTITYYREINKRVQKIFGGSHSARLLIWSDDYHQIEQMQLNQDWSSACSLLADRAVTMQAAGADLIGIACNTMHIAVPAIRERINIDIVNMIDSTTAHAADIGISRVGVLGTKTTMRMGFFDEYLANYGIEKINLSKKHEELINRLIYEELCLGVVSDEASSIVKDVVLALAQSGADGVILACTELSLIKGATLMGRIPIIDATSVHIDSLVNATISHSHT